VEGEGTLEGDREGSAKTLMPRLSPILLSLALCLAGLRLAPGAEPAPDLESIKTEANLERRARAALDFAKASVKPVLKAQEQGDPQLGVERLMQIQEAVELAHEALTSTGKHARRNPKHFKRAEIQTRNLIKLLRTLSRALHYDERKVVDSVVDRVSAINDELLLAIMTKRKKK